MTCFASVRAGGLALAILSAWLVVPVARAEPSVCDLDVDGARLCVGLRGCATEGDCVTGTRTDDYACVAIPPMSGQRCVPDCGTMFGCGQAADCPPMNGIAATCDPVESSNGTSAPNACTYRASARPLAAQITYCTTPGLHITVARLHACHTDPETGAFTEDYYRGDCDGDGCANGLDTDPCDADPSACALPDGFDSSYCASPRALACSYDASGVSCGVARACRTGGAALPCEIGTCEDGWSDVPRCRPSCGTLFLCQTGAPVRGQCPMLAGQNGTCLPLPVGVTPGVRRDGICVYADFADATCTPTPSIGFDCFTTPAGDPTSSFWEGDCDGDGAPNACDDMRCASGGGTSACYEPAGGDACRVTYVPPPDAGIDAAVLDGSVADAGTTTPDGGVGLPDASTTDAGPFDGGGSGADAATGTDGGIGSTFSGGGGCRCSAAGAGQGVRSGLALALAGLAVLVRRRARRRW
ncbi:MAG: hypothetical protein U0234_11835 [Sandaracinus sp.]